MRTDNHKCSMTLRFPYDKPDGNGFIYTKEAVEKMIHSLSGNYPIKVTGRPCNINGDVCEIVGVTTEPYSARWDEDEGVCVLTINGIIFHGGTECIVNEFTDDRAADDITITGFGLSID